MENRALLAFGLSLLVFVLWGVFLAKLQPPPEEQTAEGPPAKQEKVSPPAEQPLPGLPDAPPSAEPAPALPSTAQPAPLESAPAPLPVEETLVEVKKGNLSLIFSTRGGVLKHVNMHQYQDPETEGPIDLVKHVEGTRYPLTLITGHAAVDRVLRDGHFKPSKNFIEISESHSSDDLVLHLEHPSGLNVRRTFHFEWANALISVKTQIAAPNLVAENLKYSVIWGPGLGGQVDIQADFISFSGPTTFVNNERVENPKDDIGKGLTHRGDIQWTAFQNKYFAAALIPDQGIKSSQVIKERDDALYVGLDFESVQSAATASHFLYVGTKNLETLENSGHKLFRLIDYGWLGNKFAFLVKPILKALNFFYGMIGNYGWAIIGLTFVIKLILFPLTHKSFKSMKGMQKIAPHIKVIQERHKGDRQKMNEEMLELYKKYKVNPLGGCLPMLLQIPVFISLYHALFFSIELRGAPFMLWIQDLSAQDPFYVTPVLMGATMFLQQKMTPSTADPVQQKIFMFMPIL
ncbi:MAG: membrane protein insertase YidC, partial [Nitrospinaceae bacterium]|nr:membrane protein insertase YidC [Nitrospinaceae bacterium]NIR53873.1 membrane protein insertase YidC [Nitrospinaceae bacterium]NIS84287.1 membrane protein insertase YidC [Nitrospinaceae bacterium]NIT81094.1 membrane protein insertase YidC [Nitrospinaceae bacterium]NIU43376.1 membrane protein insertase YidC [Nitrospinaceae bacterium]